jgi:hypothetical protein
MNRRELLKGTLLSVSAAACTALVQLATPEETEALTLHAPTLMGQPEILVVPASIVGREVYVRVGLADGEQYLPIGIVDSFEMHRWPIDASTTRDGAQRFIPGLPRTFGTFYGSFRR